MKKRWQVVSVVVGLVSSQNVWATKEQDWGIAAMFRTASIPFNTQGGDQTVSTFVPMMFFDNEYVFIRGIEGGAYLWQSEEQQWQFNALTRLRFIDIPKIAQNSIEGDKADFGAQLKYQINDEWRFETELMSDDGFRFHSNYRLAAKYDFGDWELEPSVTLRYKDADFNSTYYGFSDVSKQNIGAGVDTNIALKGRYHVISNLYLLGQTSITRLDNNAYNSDVVKIVMRVSSTLALASLTIKPKNESLT